MTFKAQLTADLAAVFFNEDEFAESAIYYPVDDIERTVTILTDAEDASSQSPETPDDAQTIMVMESEVTAPRIGDKYTIDDVDWYHHSVISGGPKEGIYKILVSKSAWRNLY